MPRQKQLPKHRCIMLHLACDLRHRTLSRSALDVLCIDLYDNLSILTCSDGPEWRVMRRIHLYENGHCNVLVQSAVTPRFGATNMGPSTSKARGYWYHMREDDNNDARYTTGDLHVYARSQYSGRQCLGA